MAWSRRTPVFVVATAAWLAFAVHTVVGQHVAWGFFNEWLYNGLVALAAAVCLARAVGVPAERLAWCAMAAGLCSWAAGDLYYPFAFTHSASVPFPSWSDAGYVGFYPFAAVSLTLLVRSRVGKLTPGAWLDGLIAGFATAAVGASVIVQPVLDTTHGPTSAVITNLAYPIGDTLLIALVVCVFAATGWRPGRTWGFVGGALVVSGLADSLYLTQIASNSYVEGSFVDALWPAGLLLLAAAAWQPRRTRVLQSRPPALPAPAFFAVVAI